MLNSDIHPTYTPGVQHTPWVYIKIQHTPTCTPRKRLIHKGLGVLVYLVYVETAKRFISWERVYRPPAHTVGKIEKYIPRYIENRDTPEK